jgi:hypothetical protein
MKSKKSLALAAGCALALSVGTTAAFADTVTWSFTDGGSNSGSGTLTFGGLDANQSNFPGGHDITALTGTWNGTAISLAGGYQGSDDVFYPNGCTNASGACTAAGALLDATGFSFQAGSIFVVIFSAGGTYEGAYGPSGQPATVIGGTFEVPGSTAAVPGPVVGAGLPGLLLASTALLGWWRRRRPFK